MRILTNMYTTLSNLAVEYMQNVQISIDDKNCFQSTSYNDHDDHDDNASELQMM